MTKKSREIIIDKLVNKGNIQIFNGEMYINQNGKWLSITNDEINFYRQVLTKYKEKGWDATDINAVEKSLYKMLDKTTLHPSAIIHTPSYKIDLIKGTIENLTTKEQRELKLSIAVDPDLDNPKFTLPWWDNMLSDALNGEKDAILAYYEMLGLSMITDKRFEVSYWLTGKAGTGKSTIANEVIHAIHEKRGISTVEPADWNGTSAFFYRIANKLVNISSDNAHERSLETGVFKKLVSGEPVNANIKYQAPIEFKPTALLVSIGNSMPIIKETTDGPYRRMIMLKFDNVIAKDKKNINIKEEIRNNKDGVLNYIVNKAIKAVMDVYKRQAVTKPEMTIKSIKKNKADNNNVIAFWQEEWNGKIYQSVSKILDNKGAKWSEIYNEYKEWCTEVKSYSWGRNKFIEQSREILSNTEDYHYYKVYKLHNFRNAQLVRLWDINIDINSYSPEKGSET